MSGGGSWQPIETAPRDGRYILLWCDFGDTGKEPIVARWVDNPSPGGPFGDFRWRDYQDGAVAEKIPTHWKRVGKPRGA
jgi:hypothetical protein